MQPVHASTMSMSHRKIAIAVVATLLYTAASDALAFGAQEDQPLNASSTEFSMLDENGDGQVSAAESRKEKSLAASFGTADSNGDNHLSPEEYATWKNAVQQERLQAFLDDSIVTARIKTELLKDNGIRGLAISVETSRGLVILSGFVDNDQQVRRAVEIASGVRGVRNVKNSLIVKGQTS